MKKHSLFEDFWVAWMYIISYFLVNVYVSNSNEYKVADSTVL